MAHQSSRQMRILHAVRLLGFADSLAIADRAESSRHEVAAWLQEAESSGWVQQSGFADLYGWSLTTVGKQENERQLAAERALADPQQRIADVYAAFVPLNARLLQAVTDWQLKPTPQDAFASNDHTDRAWDTRILEELTDLSASLAPLNSQLSQVLARFDGYSMRFDVALQKAKGGVNDYVDKTNVDSCHRVWFELHEDLIATLGIDRGTAPGA